ncbi:MAG: acyl carrier protein [Ignavibacteriaceae bacterium]
MDDHKEQVKNFIVENFLFGDNSKLNDDTDFFRSGIVDSTGMLELVGFIETSFPLKVEDEELIVNNFSSLNNVSAFLARKLNHHS